MKKKTLAAFTLAAAVAAVPLWGEAPLSAAAGILENDSILGAGAIVPTMAVAVNGYHDPFEVDWEAIKQAIAATGEEARNVDVLTGRTSSIPRDVLASMAGKNVTLALQTGNGLAFSFSGRDVNNVDAQANFDLLPSGIPEAAKQHILSGTLGSYEFHVGGFPFHLNVHLNFGEEGAGKTAALYRYDEVTNTLRFEGTCHINSAGQVMFEMKQTGIYLAVSLEQPATHTVMGGDTLSRIAVRYGTSVKALKAANPQLKNPDLIRPGQSIRLY